MGVSYGHHRSIWRTAEFGVPVSNSALGVQSLRSDDLINLNDAHSGSSGARIQVYLGPFSPDVLLLVFNPFLSCLPHYNLWHVIPWVTFFIYFHAFFYSHCNSIGYYENNQRRTTTTHNGIFKPLVFGPHHPFSVSTTHFSASTTSGFRLFSAFASHLHLYQLIFIPTYHPFLVPLTYLFYSSHCLL